MAQKRKVFKLIFTQFKEAYGELSHFFKEKEVSEIYNPNYLEKLKLNSLVIERNIDLKQYAKVDIIYTIVFFGLSKEDRETVKSIFEEKYNNAFIKSIIDYAVLKPKIESYFWTKWEWINGYPNSIEIFNEIIKKRNDDSYKSKVEVKMSIGEETIPYDPFYPDNYSKYYGGHQFRLGHYYRHLFQTVKFIDNEVYLSFNEKYNYIKILRGQLSNYEQIIFFLNSLSVIGRTWELEIKSEPQKTIEENKQLLTKYNLIKNIPMEKIASEILVSNYYPNIDFETFKNQEGLKKRADLIKKYS